MNLSVYLTSNVAQRYNKEVREKDPAICYSVKDTVVTDANCVTSFVRCALTLLFLMAGLCVL